MLLISKVVARSYELCVCVLERERERERERENSVPKWNMVKKLVSGRQKWFISEIGKGVNVRRSIKLHGPLIFFVSFFTLFNF